MYQGAERRKMRRDQLQRETRHESGVKLDLLKGSMEFFGMNLLEVLVAALLALEVLVAYQSWTHKQALDEVARTQRFFACIISIPMEHRLAEVQQKGFCAHVSNFSLKNGR